MRKVFLSLLLMFFLINISAAPFQTNHALQDSNNDSAKSVSQPSLHFFNDSPQAGQGEYLCIYVNNIEPADDVILKTNLNNSADFYPSGNTRLLLLPISCSQKPGSYYLQINVQRNGQTYFSVRRSIRVLVRKYPIQNMKVSSKTAAKRSSKLWALDKPYWEKGLSKSADHPLWTGTFIRPAVGTISTQFGTLRTVNKSSSSRHSGVDISLAAGTPVRASQAGVVTLAMPLNISGNTVFVDHGCQLFSIYYHLSKITVKKGQIVKPGDLIGKVGSTGFSTGPHLHWSMELNHVYVDPALFVNPITAPVAVLNDTYQERPSN